MLQLRHLYLANDGRLNVASALFLNFCGFYIGAYITLNELSAQYFPRNLEVA